MHMFCFCHGLLCLGTDQFQPMDHINNCQCSHNKRIITKPYVYFMGYTLHDSLHITTNAEMCASLVDTKRVSNAIIASKRRRKSWTRHAMAWKRFPYHWSLFVKGNPPVTSGFPSQRTGDAELCFFLSCYPEQTGEQTVKLPVIWGVMAPIWLNCNIRFGCHGFFHVSLREIFVDFVVLVNTLRPRQNGRHFADNIFKCIFSNENVWIQIKISMEFVPKGPINNIPALVQIMAWRRPGDKSLSEPNMVRLTTHICVTRPQWVKDQFFFNRWL